jgi:SAM-dependent methyltransferase
MSLEEVHLWRGSPFERASRLLLRPSGRFTYFDKQLDYPRWSEKTVLDFGGNDGGLLPDSKGAIRPEKYYCVDVIREALNEGRKRFPEAHWFHYNRYNCSFNPTGIKDSPIPDMGTEFDIILAYSVFTHTTREEMHDLVEQLEARLAPGGTLAFTFIDPHYRSWPETYNGNNLRWRLERTQQRNLTSDVDQLMERSRGADWCALVNGTELHLNSNGAWVNEAERCLTYNIYYSVSFFRREFPYATIRPPVNGEMQHCCLIQR